MDSDAAAKLLAIYHRRQGFKFRFDQISMPDAQDYSNFIGRAKYSTPGRDGLPYTAYKGRKEFAGEVFAEVGDFLAVQEVPKGPSELEFLTDFNGQNVAFAPKGVEASDKIEPVRAPPNLRTLFLSNTDNKSFAGAINIKIIEPVLEISPACQRGFCPGRQFTLNIVVLDTFTRIFNQISGYDSAADIGDCPVTALYDICNAFPTIAHLWLFAVLSCIRLNPLVYRLIQMLFYNSEAFSYGTGTGEFLFQVLAGVRTGCPLSATLFLIALNYFLDLFEYLSDGPKISASCMCADDIGSALRALKHLNIQHSIFRMCAKVSGMELKATKCF